MSTPSTAPFVSRVDDAIRQAQTVLALSPDGLDAATTSALNEQLRRFREEVVEPVREQQGCALPGLPLGLALTVSQGEVLAGIFEGAARGSTFILMPTPEQRATLGLLALRLRAQIDQVAARAAREAAALQPPPSAADAALDNAGGAA